MNSVSSPHPPAAGYRTIWRRFVRIATTLLGLAFMLPYAAFAAAHMLDQSFELPSGGSPQAWLNIGSQQWISQTFTAGASGHIDQVDLYLGYSRHECDPFSDPACVVDAGDLVVEIRTLDVNGFPTGTLLAGGSVPESSFQSGAHGWVSVPLTSVQPVSAGTQYGILAKTSGTSPSHTSYHAHECPSWYTECAGWPYAGGIALVRTRFGEWYSEPGVDYFFRTYVAAPAARTLSGFYHPVDMNDTINTVKGGASVPMKFEVFNGGTEVTDVSQVTMQVQQRSCPSDTAQDAVEVTSTNSTSLRYDTNAGQFIYHWKTPKAAGSCYAVTASSTGGSITALFKLR